MPHIKLNAPQWFENYYEPFVGGGSVYTAFEGKQMFINDKSNELISLYQYIATQDETFFRWLDYIMLAWNSTLAFVDENRQFCEIYKQFRTDQIDEHGIKSKLHLFVKEEANNIEALLPIAFEWQRSSLYKEINTCLAHKVIRMKKIEKERHEMPEQDTFDNIETAFTSALYTYLRGLYNNKSVCNEQPNLAIALFFFYAITLIVACFGIMTKANLMYNTAVSVITTN